jgi:uncharacterized membrane protein YGL010W
MTRSGRQAPPGAYFLRMSPLSALFADYASYHRTAGNKWCHRFGIPMIMLTLFGMLARVPVVTVSGVRIDAAMLLILAAQIYYFMLEWRLGLVMLVVSAAFYLVGAALPLWLNAALFVTGWILQFVGHSAYEKRQPAFFRNFVHLLIGPLWILNNAIPLVRSEGSSRPATGGPAAST